MGIVRRVLGDANISNLWFIAVGLPLFALPYLRIKQYKNQAFQLMILASTLLFTVLFSSGSESPTYIIAVAGVMIWYLIQKDKTALVNSLMLFVLILTCFSMSDLFPKYVKQNYIIKYSLKALPCCIVWFRITYELLTKDFNKTINCSKMKKINIVIPAHNEEKNVPIMRERIAAVFSSLKDYTYEIIFVNDGSRDTTQQVLEELAAQYPEVRYIELSRNFGHQAALKAGLDNADGNAVISMDGDLQHPPELIPQLIKGWENGHDIVYTIRRYNENISLSKN